MPDHRKHITVFEHQSLRLNQLVDGVVFNKGVLSAMQRFYGDQGVPYFSLIHKGVRFNEFVGVLQVGNTIIEVLPKADNLDSSFSSKPKWRNILIDMLFAVGVFDIHAPSQSSLSLKRNSILDLYIELFIQEVEYLLHHGLVKRYRKKEGNVLALKGSLQFSRHIRENLTHQERFFVRHTTYDTEHILHFILFKTLRLLLHINTNVALHSRLGALVLNFPEMPDLKVTEATFEKIILNRKTISYRKAIDIARLLLLQYHPDVSQGRNHVLALMFDMNLLWEQFVLASLKKHKSPETRITAQTSKYFWKPATGPRMKIRPDIVIQTDTKSCIVLDTKWKLLRGCNPSPDDLRQMYVYHEYYNAAKVALVYPGARNDKASGLYLDPQSTIPLDKECSVISLSVHSAVKIWQERIYDEIADWIK